MLGTFVTIHPFSQLFNRKSQYGVQRHSHCSARFISTECPKIVQSSDADDCVLAQSVYFYCQNWNARIVCVEILFVGIQNELKRTMEISIMASSNRKLNTNRRAYGVRYVLRVVRSVITNWCRAIITVILCSKQLKREMTISPARSAIAVSHEPQNWWL